MNETKIEKMISLIDFPIAVHYLDSVADYQHTLVRLSVLNSPGVISANKNLAEILTEHLHFSALKVMSDIYDIAVSDKTRHLLSLLLTDVRLVASVFKES